MAEKKSKGFTAAEREAMRERAGELKREARGGVRPDKGDATAEVLAKIDELSPRERTLAKRVHAIITTSAPVLTPRLWYGMPAYAKDGKVVCFFQAAEKFKARYATLGFNDPAHLDEGTMWATSFALIELTDENEKRIAALVKRAAK